MKIGCGPYSKDQPFVVLVLTENVEGGELHAFKGDPVIPIDGVFEDETEGLDVRI